MDARWMPVLAASIGVLGGVGGALVGGFAANQGQEKGFERERAAAIQDLRIEENGTFMGSAEEVALTLLASSPGAERRKTEAELRETLKTLLVAKARVFLVETEGGNVRPAAFDATEALLRAVRAWNNGEEDEVERALSDGGVYGDEIDRFLVLARDDIERTEE